MGHYSHASNGIQILDPVFERSTTKRALGRAATGVG
jgi:hypothetical protein